MERAALVQRCAAPRATEGVAELCACPSEDRTEARCPEVDPRARFASLHRHQTDARHCEVARECGCAGHRRVGECAVIGENPEGTDDCAGVATRVMRGTRRGEVPELWRRREECRPRGTARRSHRDHDGAGTVCRQSRRDPCRACDHKRGCRRCTEVDRSRPCEMRACDGHACATGGGSAGRCQRGDNGACGSRVCCRIPADLDHRHASGVGGDGGCAALRVARTSPAAAARSERVAPATAAADVAGAAASAAVTAAAEGQSCAPLSPVPRTSGRAIAAP